MGFPVVDREPDSGWSRLVSSGGTSAPCSISRFIHSEK